MVSSRSVIPRRVTPVGLVSAMVREFTVGKRNYAVAHRSLAYQFKCATLSAVSR
jgi:hypothetical protein